jgi:uncharacterized integral membrane protein
MASSSQEPVRQGRQEPAAKRNRREMARDLAVLAVVVLAIVFAVVNINSVSVDWIVGSGHAPLIIVIAISVIAGFVLGWYGQRSGARRRRR